MMEHSRHFAPTEQHSRHLRREPSLELPSRKSTHRSRHGIYHGQHPGEAQNDKSYVQSWLERTSALEVAAHAGDVGGSRLKGATTAREYGDTQLTDSSIIQTPSRPSPRPRERTSHHFAPRPHGEPEHPQRQPKREKKRRRASPSPSQSAKSSTSNISMPDKARYEKRARHKTRENKYKPGHGGRPRRKVAEEKPAHARVKEKDRNRDKKRKHGLTTSKELMGKFSSDAILNDRLTMLPSMQMGMFGNGKFSKAPGDLTFGEMAFLKEPKPQEPVKAPSKTRSLESKRRDQQELENFSVFFSHKKHDGERPSKVRKTRQTRQLDNVPEEPTVAPSLHGFGRDRGRASTADKATTYMSWSSSHHQPERTSENRLEVPGRSPAEERLTEGLAERQASSSRVPTPTPEDIRHMLRNTGLYHFPSSGNGDERSKDDDLNEQQENHIRRQRQPRNSRKEDTPSEPPPSRPSLAPQAYIRPKETIPRISPSKGALPSKEVPVSPKPQAVPHSPHRPTTAGHAPLRQDPSPQPEAFHALRFQSRSPASVHERQQKKAPLEPYRYTVPVMIPPLDDNAMAVRQQLPQRPALPLPPERFGPRQDIQQLFRAESARSYLYPFRPLSVLSSRPSILSRSVNWAPYDCRSNDSPYQQLAYFRQAAQPASDMATPTGIAARPSLGSTGTGATRHSKMLDYINQIEQDVLGGRQDEEENYASSVLLQQAHITGNVGETFPPQMVCSYQTTSGFDPAQHVPWQTEERYETEYRKDIQLSPTYGGHGYEGAGPEHVHADGRPWPHTREQQPPQPRRAMEGITDGLAMYWKPNTYGL